jgi:Outer membrane protein beta-barrel domain
MCNRNLLVIITSPIAFILFTNSAAFAQDDAAATTSNADPSEASAQTTIAPGDSDAARSTSQPPAPAPPPAVACSWSKRACAYPHLVLGVDGGVSHFNESNPFGFDTSVGSISSTGPTWGLRIGAEFTPWFAIEAHYIGMSNATDADRSAGVSRHFFSNALVAEFRFTAPIPYIQPYLFVGGGLYSTTLTGSSASTELMGSTEFGLPIGVGFSVPLSRGVSVGAEGVYHRLFSESFSDNEEIGGGEPSSASAVLKFRL